MRILIFTDSRGDHKASFKTKKIWPERLSDKYDVDLMLCPFKWTTTLDFLAIVASGIVDPSTYDYIILHTGIVEHSPRPQNNAINGVYDNKAKETFTLQKLIRSSMDPRSKITNNKRYIFDHVFGDSIHQHLNTPFEVNFENQQTINMYSLEMMTTYLIPQLHKIAGQTQLIVINSNRILRDWDGNYTRGRPRNINIVDQYSKIFAQELRCLDLMKWTDSQIRKFTVDNMHLSEEGSDWIYDKLMTMIT